MKIITGGSGIGKSRWLYQELKKYKANLVKEVCLIVPEQFTLEAEQEYLQQTGELGIIGFEITSFSHIMQQVVQFYQPSAKYWMNDLGKVLMLDQVLEASEEEIGALKRLRGKPRLLQDFYRDLMEGKWQSEEIQRVAAASETEGGELSEKLKALQRLLLRYEASLAKEGLVDEVVYAEIVCELLRVYCPYESAVLFIDQFWGFSTLELEVIAALEEQAESVTVILTMETQYDSRIFEPVKGTRKVLLQKFPDSEEIEFSANQGIDHGFAELNQLWLGAKRKRDVILDDVAIFSALQADEEVRFCASKMMEWNDAGIPFEDMQVVVSDYQGYLPLIRRIFQQGGIPVHLDHNRRIADYPAAQGVLVFLRFQESGWYEDFIAAIKSGYFAISATDIDRFEINVKQRGWKRFAVWQRSLLAQDAKSESTMLLKLLDEGRKRRKSARVDQHWKTLCSVLKRTGYFERFQKRDESLNSESFRSEHQSVWRGFEAVVDQMIALHGENRITACEFREQFSLGCELIRVGVLPAVCGEVTVRDLIRSRSTSKRCTIVLGMNEGKFPTIESKSGFFDFEEREWLAGHEMKMGNTRIYQMQLQELSLYQVLAKTRETIIFLWSRKDRNFDNLSPSGFLIDLEGGAKGLPVRTVEWKDLMRSKGEALRFCRQIFRKIQDGKAVQEEQRETAEAIFQGLPPAQQREMLELLQYGNQVLPLGDSVAGALYHQGETSITELELHNQCPFAHFLTYGIQPREVKPYEIEDPDVGQVLHDLMELGFEAYNNDRFIHERLEEEFQKIADPYFTEYREGLFQASQTNQYIERKIRESILVSLRQLIDQKEQSKFQSVGQEIRFGNEPGDLNPICVEISEGKTVSVCGRIDRVDQFQAVDQLYVQVIDYKSGRTLIDQDEIMGGIHLQLPTYMNVCRLNDQKQSMVPAGFFHYYLDRPLPTLLPDTDLSEQIRDFYRMRGFFLADQEVIVGMDESLLETGASKAVAVRLKKDGTVKKSAQMVDRERMNEILDQNLKCIEETVHGIYSGDIRIHPYKGKNVQSCSHCSFGAICQFDTCFVDNETRMLSNDLEGREES